MSEHAKVELPDYLKDIIDESAKDMVTQSGSSPRISLKGRQFRFKKDGEEILKTTDPIHIIIIGVVPEAHMAKTFYIHGYQPDSSDPPDCSSFFGEIPDNWVSSPQAANCKDCPNQVWGSAKSMSGKKAKACKDSKRLLVIDAKEATEDEPTIYLLNVTIASLKALTTYGKFLIENKLPMAAVITQVEFVDSDFPQIEFAFKGVLSENIGKPMLELSSKKDWMVDKPKAIAGPSPGSVKQIETNADVKETVSINQDNVLPDSEQQSSTEILDKW